MPIDLDSVLTNAELDEWLGGQAESATTLRPAAWADTTPARQHALGETLWLFGLAKPPIAEDSISDPPILKRCILYGSAARIYELAMTQAPEPGLFFEIEKRYRLRFENEVQRVIDLINEQRPPDPKGRSRRVINLERR